MTSKSLVSIDQCSKEDILRILDNARKFEENPNRKLLEGKVAATDVYKRQVERVLEYGLFSDWQLLRSRLSVTEIAKLAKQFRQLDTKTLARCV